MSGIAGKDKSLSETGKKGRTLKQAIIAMFSGGSKAWKSNRK